MLRRLDLTGVSGTHRGDAVGIEEPGLHEVDGAVELQPLHGEEMRRQIEVRERGGREAALVGEVMNGEHASRDGAAAGAQVGGGKPCMPVVAVHYVGAPAANATVGEARRGPAKQREAARVVRPVLPVGSEIRIARAFVK